VPARPDDIADDVDVVIPTLGRPELRSCLDALEQGACRPGSVILVHQGDGRDVAQLATALTARGLPTEYLHSDARGTAQGTNAGIAHAARPLVAITHDDCIPRPDWLATMRARLHAHPRAIITGQVRPLGGTAPGVITLEHEQVHDRPLLRRDPLFPDNMGFARSTFTRVGPFDEDPRLRFSEDAEWSYRALRARETIVYAPEVVVGHLAIRDAAARAATYRRYVRCQGAFYGKHLRRGDQFVLVRAGFDLLRGPWMMLRGRLAGHGDTVAYGRAYLSQLVPGLVEGLRAP
jgi:GT2 family glycosyltransferase